MGRSSKEVYGAAGQSNLLTFDPAKLTLVTDPKHPLYDERVHLPVNEGLKRSIKARGVVQPISVTLDPETGLVLVAAGRQRVKAAVAANIELAAEGLAPKNIPAVPHQAGPKSAMGVMLAENSARSEETPLQRARKFAALLSQGYDEEQVADLAGVTAQTVRNGLELLQMPESTRVAVEAGHITASDARKVAKLPVEQQREKVEALVKATTTEGAAPQQRKATKRQAIVDAGLAKAGMRGKREVKAARDAMAEGPARELLNWVLGESEAIPA